MSRYFDIDGNPIDLMTWGQSVGTKHIGSNHVCDIHVSTVWLGLDHNWGDGPPLIFETMVFGYGDDEYQWRYSTKEDAAAGHAEVLAAVQAGTLAPDFEPAGAA